MNRILLFLMPLLIAGLAYVGWFGITTKEPVVAEACRATYPHQVVTPFIRTWWECRRQTPCGADERFDKHNATVRVIQCLCAGADDNRDNIISLYSELPLTTFPSQDDQYICATVAEQGRL